METFRKLSALLLALCMVFSLAACGGSAAPAAEEAPAEEAVAEEAPAAEEAAEEPAEEPAEAAEEPAEEAAEEPAADGETVKIGVLLPFSGATSYYGDVQNNGIEFCANYINENGGVLDGQKVELVIGDSASDPETGVSAFERLVDQGVVAVVGPYNSTVAAATAPLAIQHGVPYVIINATAENFMSEANKYVYRTNTGSTDGDPMWSLVIDYLNSVRPDNPTDKIAVVYDEGDWGAAAVETWRANAEAMGYEVVVDEAVNESMTDMSSLVAKIDAAETDLVIVAAFTAATNLLCRTMADYGCTAKVAGLGGGIGDINFIDECGEASEGALYSAPWVPSYGGAAPEAEELAAQFEEEYGYSMTMEPCWGWLGIATIINAINEAGSADREAVADALYAMDVDADDWALWFSGYEGVHFATDGQERDNFTSDNHMRFNNNDKLGETDGMVLVQVQDGEWKIVFPASYTDGADLINY